MRVFEPLRFVRGATVALGALGYGTEDSLVVSVADSYGTGVVIVLRDFQCKHGLSSVRIRRYVRRRDREGIRKMY